jgi:hypothetical protein
VKDPANAFAARYHQTEVGQIPVISGPINDPQGNDPFPASLMNDLTSAGYYPAGFFQRFPFFRIICGPDQPPILACQPAAPASRAAR